MNAQNVRIIQALDDAKMFTYEGKPKPWLWQTPSFPKSTEEGRVHGSGLVTADVADFSRGDGLEWHYSRAYLSRRQMAMVYVLDWISHAFARRFVVVLGCTHRYDDVLGRLSVRFAR